MGRFWDWLLRLSRFRSTCPNCESAITGGHRCSPTRPQCVEKRCPDFPMEDCIVCGGTGWCWPNWINLRLVDRRFAQYRREQFARKLMDEPEIGVDYGNGEVDETVLSDVCSQCHRRVRCWVNCEVCDSVLCDACDVRDDRCREGVMCGSCLEQAKKDGGFDDDTE